MDATHSNENLVHEDLTLLSPEYLQRKLYFLVDQLKSMHSNLPEYERDIRIVE